MCTSYSCSLFIAYPPVQATVFFFNNMFKENYQLLTIQTS
ncbi:unnamed protein product [Rhodiola kirilowii]